MSRWAQKELEAIDAAQELRLASARGDGTLRRPVTIWVVRIGEEVYVRSVNGRGSAWFRGVQSRHEARIRAGGIEKDVRLVETDEAGEQIDVAYQTQVRPSLSDDRRVDRRASGAGRDAEAHTTRGGNLMHKRTLGDNLEVSAIGLGCMGMSTRISTVPGQTTDGLADPDGR
jgi:hypothetical protein